MSDQEAALSHRASFADDPPMGVRGSATTDRPSFPHRLVALILRTTSPSAPVWLAIGAVTIALETLVVYLLKQVGLVNEFGLVYLLGVLVVSTVWKFRLAVVMSLASAVAFDCFRKWPTDFVLSVADDGVVIAIFLVVALLANTLAGIARARADEADARRREADLAAELAWLMLQSDELHEAMDKAGRRLAEVFQLSFAVVELETMAGGGTAMAIPLLDNETLLGTFLVPSELPKSVQNRLHQTVVPVLEALVAAATEREATNSALDASRKELERFFELSSDLLCIGGPEYLTRTNPAFERTLGYSHDQLRSRPLLDLTHPADRSRTRNLLDGLLSANGYARFENRLVRQDGVECQVEWNVVSDQALLYCAARDVTDRRREQDRLREAQRTIEASHHEVSVLAQQQAALRGIATLIARGASVSEVLSVVVQELSGFAGVCGALVLRYESDDVASVIAVSGGDPMAGIAMDHPVSLTGDGIATAVLRGGLAARIEDHSSAGTPDAHFRSLVGAPIVFHDRVWGVAIVGSSESGQLRADTEARVSDFSDLVSTAIVNAETRAELTASRARIVTAADEARRRLERDLHDGAQQRLVSLGLELHEAQNCVPPELPTLKERIASIINGLRGVASDLQEISRGIHPAILSKGGLGPAIKALARRSAIPVTLDLAVNRRLPTSAEVAAYYVVAEALTNATKHAQASDVLVSVSVEDAAALRISIKDNGVGGADLRKGSGLIGLTDRVEALEGTIEISSPAGVGTSLRVIVPLDTSASSSGRAFRRT